MFYRDERLALFIDGSNLYAFVHNEPVGRYDPDGRKSQGRGIIAVVLGWFTGCGKGPKAPGFPNLSPNCAKDPDVKLSYQKLLDCNSDTSDGNAECTTICDCIAQGTDVGANYCVKSCLLAYEKRCY